MFTCFKNDKEKKEEQFVQKSGQSSKQFLRLKIKKQRPCNSLWFLGHMFVELVHIGCWRRRSCILLKPGGRNIYCGEIKHSLCFSASKGQIVQGMTRHVTENVKFRENPCSPVQESQWKGVFKQPQTLVGAYQSQT